MIQLKEYITESVEVNEKQSIMNWLLNHWTFAGAIPKVSRRGENYFVDVNADEAVAADEVIVKLRHIRMSKLTNGKFQWRTVKGTFDISNSQIKSLMDGPKETVRFQARNCSELKDLKGAPEVSTYFSVAGSGIKNLRGCPENVQFLSLDDCPSLESFAGITNDIKEVVCGNCKQLDKLTLPSNFKGNISYE